MNRLIRTMRSDLMGKLLDRTRNDLNEVDTHRSAINQFATLPEITIAHRLVVSVWDYI